MNKKLILWIIVLIALINIAFAFNENYPSSTNPLGADHYYSFNESSTTKITDYIGSTDLTITNGDAGVRTPAIWGNGFNMTTAKSQSGVNTTGFFDGGNAYCFHLKVKIPANLATQGRILVTQATGRRIIVTQASGGGNLIIQHQQADADYNAYTLSHLEPGKWINLTITWDAQNRRIWLNDTMVQKTAITDWKVNGADYDAIGEWFAGEYFAGQIEEFIWFNSNCSLFQINSMILSNYTDAPLVSTSNVDLLFTNTTSNIWKTLFNEGEDIYAYANYTINGLPSVNQSNASCNISFVDGLGETTYKDTNFTLCSSGCDYDQYNETLNFLHTTNAYASDIRFKACSNNLPTLPFFVNLNCSTGSITYEIPATDIPLCSLGQAQFNFTSAICYDVNNLNLSFWIEGNQPATKTKIITDAEVDRIFSVHTYTNVTFNESLKMFRIPKHNEYYIHGSKRIYANCSYDPDPTLNNGADENITIVNLPPSISFQQINNTQGITMIYDGVEIEHSGGLWTFFTNVFDNDLTTINYTLIVANGTMIYSAVNTTNQLVEIDGEIFTDFINNPINFTICANDSYGDYTCSAINFTVNDTLDPVCTGFSDVNVDENTYYTWDVSCVDESLYSFNITCDTGWNYSIYGMNEQTFTFTNQTAINITNVCTYKICDGHTDKDLKDVKVDKLKDKLIFDNIVTIESLEESVSFDVEKFSDRYKFELELITKTDHLSFIIESRSKIEIIENSEYIGHIVADDLYWIDFVSKDVVDAQITRLNDKIVMVNLTLDKEVKKIKFDSIGLLNCIEGVITLTAADTNPYDNALPTDWSLDMDTSTTAGVMILFFYLALICIVFILGSVLKIPVLIFLASSMMFFLGFIIAFELSILFGIMTCFVALVLLIVGALML